MYRLKKSKIVFFHLKRSYRKKKKHLSKEAQLEVKTALCSLQKTLIDQDRLGADQEAKKVEQLAKRHLKKSFLNSLCNFVFSLAFALILAVIIRSLWFEFFEIPTGSMRPTIQEKDHLAVSKTAFGINVPLLARHLYFDPSLVKRGGIVIFTSANLDLPNIDTRYFYLFPGKKQFVKRLFGKPGDTLYFYGGRLYGIDQDGKDISPQLQPALLDQIDHVPYIRLEGNAPITSLSSSRGAPFSFVLKQMNQAVAELKLTRSKRVEGKLLPPYSERMSDYYELFGFENYGLSRLLTKEQVAALGVAPTYKLKEAPLYLEIIHHPSVKTATLVEGPYRHLYPSVGTNSTLLPLQNAQLKTLLSNLYTARFTVKKGMLYRYGGSIKVGNSRSSCPVINAIPNGTYEFYYGKGYEILWGGIRKELPPNHPLMRYAFKRFALFYNLGIEFDTRFAPYAANSLLLPSRYVYYREGDLYAMGGRLLKKGDPLLTRFIANEKLKEQNAPLRRPYHPFIDAGPPLTKEGKIDAAKIQRYGVKVPDNHYLVLGDNYAMSSDSRAFGFVPEDNLRGIPRFIFWPPGPRLGALLQPPYPTFTLPRTIIWAIFLLTLALWRYYYRKRHRLSEPID